MDIVTTSLDALLQRATNPQNQNIDTAAVEAFCALVNKEKDGAHIGVKLIASRIHSQQEREVLQTLHILDICMQRCGSLFQGEVGKFRFLNEMIKLVSPKYLGSQTPMSVRQKVLQLMYLWTLDYPKETKIKEAYDMLKKQGVIREAPLSVSAENYTAPERRTNSVFQDEEKSKLLKKLLQSKNPEDLQAANRLIKSMVKEDDKRAELKSKAICGLESVHNNVRLLNEMLDSYKPDISSKDELELINELHQSCENLKPVIIRLILDSRENGDLDNAVRQASNELNAVLEKYTSVIVYGNISNISKSETGNSLSLLDFEPLDNSTASTLLKSPMSPKADSPSVQPNSDIDVLSDIFAVNNISVEGSEKDILQPISASKANEQTDACIDNNNKTKGLEDLDALGEHLMRENLQSATRLGPQFNKPPEKIPMNLLSKQNEVKSLQNNANIVEMSTPMKMDLSILLDRIELPRGKTAENENIADDLLVDISDNAPKKDDGVEKVIVEPEPVQTKETSAATEISETKQQEVKLSDIFVNLESIKPSSVPPIMALEEKNGISVTFHFAKDKPRDDITVVVVTITSKNENPLKSLLFRAIVPKTCKVKLQPASGTELPPFNPFLPPSAITQIMLVANPEKVQASLKFIVSYNIDDETTTEMGEIEKLPDVI